MKTQHASTMVSLTPRGWVPDPNTTGGGSAPETLYINESYWVSLGKPASIEDFHEKVEETRKQGINTIDFRGIQTPKSDA